MMRMMSKAAATVLLVLCSGLAQDARAGRSRLTSRSATQSDSARRSSRTTRRWGLTPTLPTATVASSRCTPISSRRVTAPGPTSSTWASTARRRPVSPRAVGRVPPGPGFTDASLAELNTHYTGANPPTQASLLASTITSEAAAGHIIGNISISLGSNDLYYLALHSQNPLADLPAALATFKSNYESLLTTIRASLPNANIDLIGSYNPFTATPSSPFAPLAGYAIPLLNQEISAVAAEFHANYIDLFNTPLTTDAANYTLILNQGDAHPNFDKGYSVIAAQMQAVPEPSSMVLLTIGLLGLAGGSVASRRLRTVA